MNRKKMWEKKKLKVKKKLLDQERDGGKLREKTGAKVYL